jgi:hypothetical protein
MYFEDLAESGMCFLCDKSPEKLRAALKRVGQQADAHIQQLREEIAQLQNLLDKKKKKNNPYGY